MTLLLGIDIGTSSVKALVFDSELSQIVATHAQEYPISTPHIGYTEQSPNDYWNATIEAVRRVAHPDISAISFSGQMHGTVLLDDTLQTFHPAIIWADGRSTAQVERLARLPNYLQTTGTHPATGFMSATLAWLAEHQPSLLARARHVILPKDYVRLQMTGEVATDISDASSTGLLDVQRGVWADDIIQQAGLARTIFPPILASYAHAGTLIPSAAQALGLRSGIPVMVGCADQPAQAIGNGLIQVGKASVTIGTGGQVFVPCRDFRTDARLHVFNHAVPNTWYVLGAILSAGLSLRWLRNLVGMSHLPDAYAILSAEASQTPLGADGLIFLPYLTGERTPHMDAHARGVFIGLSYHHTRGHLARAVMEGVSFALRQTLEISLGLAGQVDSVIASGGGADSDVWRGIMADVFGLPLQKSLLTEQACVGASLLAGVGMGVYRDLPEACAQVVRYGEVTPPDAVRHTHYQALYERFVDLYPRLREDMHFLARSAVSP